MNKTTVSLSCTADPVPESLKTGTSRCPYLYPNGKRCSLPGSPAHSGFCLRHSQLIAPVGFPVPIQNDSEDLSAELLPELSQFSSSLDINKFLTRLLILITKGRVSPAAPPSWLTLPTSFSTPIAPSLAITSSNPNKKASCSTSATGPVPTTALALRAPPVMSGPSKLDIFPIRGKNPHDVLFCRNKLWLALCFFCFLEESRPIFLAKWTCPGETASARPAENRRWTRVGDNDGGAAQALSLSILSKC